ncbi:hypothetical protein D1872_223140 [compost metagenome]
MGEREWKSRLSGDRMAVPSNGGYLRSVEERGVERGVPLQNRAADRSVFFGNEGEMDSGPCPGIPGARGAGGAAVRHDRYVADLEADRRRSARYRLQQRFAHAHVQHS